MELLLLGWVNAAPKVIDREIWQSMQRNNMEDCSFHFCSVTKLDPDLHFVLKEYVPDKTNHFDYFKCYNEIRDTFFLKQKISERFILERDFKFDRN